MTDADMVRVRVYNVGFGDSILVDLPTPAGDRARVLIDCGSVSFGDTGVDTESVVERIVDDVTIDGVPRIDVVVATHRHKDHVSAFCRSEWRSVHVGEVWQPWTENPDDPDARSLRESQLQLAQAIVESEPRLRADARIDAATAELILAMGANALSNAESVRTLRTGFAGAPVRRYLARRRRPRRPHMLGRRPVHVLGPTRSLDVIRRMQPPSDQTYLALLPLAAAGSASAPPSMDRPFPWLAPMGWEEYGAAGRDADNPRKVDHGGPKGQLKRLIETDSLLTAAVLDHALNNTSLMLSFQVGDQFLLFPGDSQWGTWETAMETAWSRDVLERTTFYKISHHGSDNATPRRFVEELMPEGCWSIASVTPYSQWTDIPKPGLLAALERKAPSRVFTTMTPPAAPPPEVSVEDGGRVIEFRLSAP
jgi:beta-lactamase superfamily II metal-dependent hydrolase